MSTIGDLSKVIPAQNVKIFRSDAELILTSDVKVLGGRHVINTLNTRAAPIDSYVWRIREIEATVAWTKTLQEDIEADNTLNSRSALTVRPWKISGLNLGGSGNDDPITTYQAVVYDYSVNAPDVGTSTITIKLRIARDAS